MVRTDKSYGMRAKICERIRRDLARDPASILDDMATKRGDLMAKAIERTPGLKVRLLPIYAILAVFNVGAWVWAFSAFWHKPTLLGVGLVIYGVGLRHAVDADHIAAIDNVTRKLMQMKQRPVTVGFYFAMGHSSVVIIAAIAVAIAASLLNSFGAFQSVSGVIGTAISAFFLLAIAVMNVLVFASIFKTYRRVRRGGDYVEEDVDALLNNRGVVARIVRPLFRLVTKSWHMFPLGFLFGLGFDTATEVAMFGVSAAQASKNVPFAAIAVFPFLFAASMSLVDTTDGVMMLRAYDWAFVKPARKLCYNLTITGGSIVVALLVGGIEALGLISDQFKLRGRFWSSVGELNDNFINLGFAIVGLFLLAWMGSYLFHRVQKREEVDDGKTGMIMP
jgi:nickel/cobalt transporter (NiCoT) family protein